MRVKSLIIFLIIFSCGTTKIFSQGLYGGINLQLGFPMGEFKKKVDRIGVGIAAHGFWNPSPAFPFGIGLNFGYLNYGSESRYEPFSPTIPDVTVRVDRTNNLVNFHLVFQVAPQRGSFRPYIEGLIGGSYLFTETKIINTSKNDEVASSTNFDDYAWSYGGGGGLMIYLTTLKSENDKLASSSELFLDIKGRYLYGTEAKYLKEGSVIIQGGKVYYCLLYTS
ncbi:MAG: hypothetical protein N3A61_02205, partial [Ignavibacteria bacterium]|nr:hypothetical protein [Ignavibacteria bacterium]